MLQVVVVDGSVGYRTILRIAVDLVIPLGRPFGLITRM
jgi:hypothetical protein